MLTGDIRNKVDTWKAFWAGSIVGRARQQMQRLAR